MGRKRRSKKGHARRKVDRSERVLPPPEAAQHHRPWPLQSLLVAGHPDGIDADEFEAALQIVEAFRALTLQLGTQSLPLEAERVAGWHGGMSDRDAERVACWFEWSLRLPTGLPPRLVGWIEDEQSIGSVEVLRRACRLWDRVRSDRKRGVSAVDKPPSVVLTLSPVEVRPQHIAARPVNLPAGALSVPAGILPHLTSSHPMPAQLRHAVPRPVAGPSHAKQTAHPSTIRAWRG